MSKECLKELLVVPLRTVNSFKRVVWRESTAYKSINSAINAKETKWKEKHFNDALESITIIIRDLADNQDIRSSKETTLKFGDALLNLKAKINEVLKELIINA